MRCTLLFTVMLGASALAGCAAKLQLIDRSISVVHLGESIGGTSGNTGQAQASIKGVTYRGPWVYSANGGSYSLALGSATSTALSGSRTVTAAGNSTTQVFTTSAQGSGLINLRADDGRFIRCVCNFASWTDTGIGQCVRNDSREFDLAISS